MVSTQVAIANFVFASIDVSIYDLVFIETKQQ